MTSAFVHVQPVHFIFNMYWLLILGPVLEREFGSVRLLVFMVATAFASSGWELAVGHTGIGFSGVGYAMVGFGWVAAKHRTYLKAVFSDQVLNLFLVWGAICVVTTVLKVMNVGNVAHFAGLVFGALVAVGYFKKSSPAMIGAVAMIGLAVAPLFWSPLSPAWVYVQGAKAVDRKDNAQAIKLFNRSLEMGYEPAQPLYYLAEIYAYTYNIPQYRKTLERLRQIHPAYVKEITDRYYDPEGAESLGVQSNQAYDRGEYILAIELAKSALQKGLDPKSGWRALAQMYLVNGQEREYRDAIEHLRKIDPKLAENATKELSNIKNQRAPSK